MVFWVAESENEVDFDVWQQGKKLVFFKIKKKKKKFWFFSILLNKSTFFLIELELQNYCKHEILDHDKQCLIFFAILSSSADEFSA